jgi:hypothetical protein
MATNEVKVENPTYETGKTVKKALQEFGLAAGAAILVVLAELVGNLLTSGEVGSFLPSKYLILLPVIAMIGRALLNWAKHRKVTIEHDSPSPVGTVLHSVPDRTYGSRLSSETFPETVERVKDEIGAAAESAAKTKAAEIRAKLRARKF